jgi:hypothetical protein
VKKFYLLYFSLFYLSACKKWDKPEPTPSYIYIERIDLSVNSTEGTASHAIIDAWVYVDDQPIGVFNLPCTVPILEEGYHKISIFPGIKNDGLVESRAKYILMTEYENSTINLIPGQVVNMTGANQPVVTYDSPADIDIWEENFDDAAINFNSDPNSDVGITFVNDSTTAFEGQGMGKIDMPSGYNFCRVITSQSFVLPRGGKVVYVELNYKTNNSMAIGIQSIQGSELINTDNTVLNATDGVWKKVYVNLTEITSNQVNADSFKFIITVQKDDSATDVLNYIDNFKVVYDK